MDVIQGYEIKQTVLFDNGRGVAFGENPNAPQPFVTWMFTQDENGLRDYEWGHYFIDGTAAEKDFTARAKDYQRRYGVREVKRPISEQMKDAAEQARREAAPTATDRSTPDREGR